MASPWAAHRGKNGRFGQAVEPRRAAPPDEPVRHKMLDALGDLALAGAPLIGHYKGVRAGHADQHVVARLCNAGACAGGLMSKPPVSGHGLVWDEVPVA